VCVWFESPLRHRVNRLPLLPLRRRGPFGVGGGPATLEPMAPSTQGLDKPSDLSGFGERWSDQCDASVDQVFHGGIHSEPVPQDHGR
jgi:hypothetical protein